MSNAIVSVHPDGWKATWPGFPKAFALFREVPGGRVEVSDIFRDAAQPKGSAGCMLAEAFAGAGVSRPNVVRFVNIMADQPTIAQIEQQGLPVQSTVLGRVLLALASELGAMPQGWLSGRDAREKFWIEARFLYR